MNGSPSRLRSLMHWHAGWYTMLAAVGLTLIGIESIGTTDPYYAKKQTVWFVIALCLLPLYCWPRPRMIGLWSYGLFGGTIALLILVIIPGVPPVIVPRINNATSWIDLQFMRLQPSELTKITFVLAIAWYLRHRRSYRTLKGLLVPFGLLFLPMALILKQPDLGTAIIFAPTLLAVLVAAGAKLRHIGSLLGLGCIVVALVVASIYFAPRMANLLLKPHQQTRFKAIISQQIGDTQYDDSSNYQQLKAIKLIGAGRLEGYGQERSALMLDVHNLPERHNDMVFAVVVNRWGLLGSLVLLALNVIILTCFATIGWRSRDPFVRLAMVGFAALIFSQLTIHVAVNIGLMPVTGITLPFVSYGGSSLVTTFAMVGLAINFAATKPAILSRPSFQFDRAKTAAS